MLGFSLLTVSLFTGLIVWMFGIRPHVGRRGGTLVTGANWGVSAWADWQTCSEIARKRKDLTARTLSIFFLLAQLGAVAGAVLLLLGL